MNETASLNGATARQRIVTVIREWLEDDWFDVDALADAVMATLGLA